MLFDFLRNPASYDFIDVIVGLFAALAVIFITMPVHEFAHALAATKLGDPTPKYSGRLSLNPMNHIDYIGALCIILFGFGWAKPVGVNPRNFRDVKRGMAVTAVAGPLSNIVMAFILTFAAYGILFFTAGFGFLFQVAHFLYNIAYINATLAVFNLIPVPPLDGSRILGIILPDRIYYKLMQYERYFYYAVIALMILGAFDRPLSFLVGNLMDVLTFIPRKLFF